MRRREEVVRGLFTRQTIALTLAVAFVGSLMVDSFVNIMPGLVSEFYRLAAGLVATILGARFSIRVFDRLRHDFPIRASAWRFLSLATLIWGAGWITYGTLRFGFHMESAQIVTRWFEVTAALMAASGMALLMYSWPITGRMRLLLDSVIATSSVAVLSWYFVITPVWHATPGTTMHKALAIFEPTACTILLFAAIVLLIVASGVKRMTASVTILGVSGLALGLSGIIDMIVAKAPWIGQLELNRFLAPWGWMCLALAAKWWSDEQETARDAKSELRQTLKPLSAMSISGPYAVAVLSFGLVAVRELQERGHVSGAIFYMGATLMSLIVLRQVLTLVDNQKLGVQLAEFNQGLEFTIDRRTKQLQSLYSLAKAIGNSLDLEGVIKNSTDHAMHALHADAYILNLTPFAFSAHARVGQIVRQAGLEENKWILDQLNILETPWAASFGTLHDPTFARHGKYCIAPVLFKGRGYGWLCMIRWEEGFDKSEASLLESIGIEVGTALENARLYEIARQMADVDPVSGLLNHRAAQERFDFAFRYAKEQKEPVSVLMIDVNNFKFFNDTYGHLAGDHVLKSVAKILRESCRPHDVPARYGGDEFLVVLPNTTLARAEELVESIQQRVAREGYPEPGSDRVIPYALSIGSAAYPEEATSRHELLSIADKNMYQAKRAASGGAPSARRSTVRNSDASPDGFDLLDSMITAVDNKDYYTRAHSEEVTEYALWIAHELGLSEEAMKTIRIAGLLHDVGKIGIPDEILRKPGHLTDEEFEVMRQHPVVGAFMVSNIPGLGDIVPGVKHHHERFDGKGYPDRLAGEAIPLLARILSVPDAFSAMTTDRPYRKGMDWRTAFTKIDEGSGTQFDPVIVAAFGRALERRKPAQQEIARAA